ncbi:uncharacterized protein LOC143012822 [Genypterus blacodes]|uniref:uncharacterized protein LOC143012822 n=1 Tax=Genypterus blacodes TaxID=154954 RepID=UPI003F75ED3C
MNREGDKSAKIAHRSQKPRAQQQGSCQKKRRDPSSKDAPSGSSLSVQCIPGKEATNAARGKRPGRSSSGVPTDFHRNPGTHRKLSDASNASEDLSKDSGCVSGKNSSSDSSSEISDCQSEGNKQDSPSSEAELSWIDGRVYVSPGSEGKGESKPIDTPASQPDTGGSPSLLCSSGQLMDLMMGETTEDLIREVEDLRSENEYLKDEVEELRCEMLEMRDLFQEEGAYQLQQLRLQLEQANKMCRILQYRLRKAERRSIRVAKTGQVDGELVRTLEHDIKVAKSVSLRLYNDLEVVQTRNSQLEWENEGLRGKTQELEVAKQVLQNEMEKARENTLRRKSVRSTPSKAERRLSQQSEDDSADLKCQLHFAKEELALMCKKLTKMVSESERMREELARYQSVYGDIDAAESPGGKVNNAHAREAEVKVHLKLVEEEATLLSRRIVELEVENRGLRAEMSDLRERVGGGGVEEEEDNQEVVEEKQLPSTPVKDSNCRKQSLKVECTGKQEKSDTGTTQTEGMISACEIPREGPVGGEWDPLDLHEKDNNNQKIDRDLKVMTVKDCEALLALRDHSCILSSAIQLLKTTSKNGNCTSPLCAFVSAAEVDSKAQNGFLTDPLNEALELLQAMLVAFIGRLESLLTGGDGGKLSLQQDGNVWDPHTFSFLSGGCTVCHEDNIEKSASMPHFAEDLRTTEVKDRARQTSQRDVFTICRDTKMQLALQILSVLHRWCHLNGPEVDEPETRDETLSLLRSLLQDLSPEVQEGQNEFDIEGTQDKSTECLTRVIQDERHPETDRMCNSKDKRLKRHISAHGKKKNWCYVNQEAAQLDQEDPFKTWDHPVMPLSFPDLDFEQMSMERSHTAPEKTTFRIYYSPPSARRVQVAQLQKSPTTDRESLSVVGGSSSLWCTPPTSFSPLCLGSPSNLSDDMKEMTASWRRDEERRGRSHGRWVDVVCSGTQTHKGPQMVSVGLQTDGAQGPVSVKNSPSRVPNSSMAPIRSNHISTSLEGITSKIGRSRPTSTSPKLYRRHSASGASSLASSTAYSSSMSSSSSSAAASREQAFWNLSPQSPAAPTLTRQTNHQATRGLHPSSFNSELSGRSTKTPSKIAGANRYGLVTEFLRRVSGRTDKPVPVSGQKAKSGLKNLENVPTRPPAVPLHRTDSVTRIVNQRFMKQREEASRTQKEEKGSSLNQSVKQSSTAEDGNYECSSGSTLTFCFARPSRSTQRQASNQSKVQRHRYSPPVRTSAE